MRIKEITSEFNFENVILYILLCTRVKIVERAYIGKRLENFFAYNQSENGSWFCQ